VNPLPAIPPITVSELRERKIVCLLCLLAAIHTFVFSAAFPFFNNVDEAMHFDLAVRYSHGHVPRTLEPLSPETLWYVGAYGSTEYRYPKSWPLWQSSGPAAGEPLEKIESSSEYQRLKLYQNYESTQPPLYYAVAGAFWHLGKLCGFHGGGFLYALRFLNIFYVAVLVWIGYLSALFIFPSYWLLRMGIPAVLAFLPQKACYSIANDVLSPLYFGLAFVCLMQLLRAETPGVWIGAATGVALAAAVLAKLTNLPLLAVSMAALCVKFRDLIKAGKFRSSLRSFAALSFCAGSPIAAWAVWCKIHFGDFTGSELKIHYFGWGRKPFDEWWHHPIFTPGGFWAFISRLIPSLWQDEMVWRGSEMTIPAINAVYFVASLSVLSLALLALFRNTGTTRTQSRALWLCWACFVASVAFLAYLSVILDFRGWANPTHDFPYFTAGRMMLGAIIPFLIIFLYGIEYLVRDFPNKCVRPVILTGIVSFMLVSEIVTDWPVFSSPFNWFHI